MVVVTLTPPACSEGKSNIDTLKFTTGRNNKIVKKVISIGVL